MCYAGGPRCSDNKLSSKDKQAKIEKRITKHREKLAELDDVKDKEQVDTIRTAIARNTRALNFPTEKAESDNVLSSVNEPDGGATYSFTRKESPQVGFCYSPYPERSQAISAQEFSELSHRGQFDKLMDYQETNSDVLNKPGHYVGLWNDPDSGTIYLDVSCHTMNAHQARKQCEEKDQIAYFDLQDFSSVTVDKNATSGQKS